MRPATLTLAPLLLLCAALVARGAEPAAAPAESPDPAGEVEAEVEAEVEVADSGGAAAAADPDAELSAPSIERGAVGYDEEGRRGHIHVVRLGDTLWDISDAYLGTPWVWPSVWQTNQEIANPHLIYPGDRIWITSSVMRRVTREEAERLLSGSPAEDVPAAMQEALGDFSEGLERAETLPQAGLERAGLLTVEELDAATSVVESPTPRIWLSEGDRMFLGLQEGEVAVGDEFTIFRTSEPVHDPDTGDLFGYYIDILGWVEVTELHRESAEAVVRQSYSEMQRGDGVTPRIRMPDEVVPQPTPDAVEGKIVYLPHHRGMGGHDDFVYLNRGSLHGLQPGNRLEVYRPLGYAQDRVRDNEVALPDEIVASVLVVSSRPATAVARVMRASTELQAGDRVRAGTAPPE